MRKSSGKTPRFAFLAANTPEARRARQRLIARYGAADPGRAAVIVALGGDGFMLQTLHRFMGRKVGIFGMNCGTIGFLMNRYDEAGLPARLAKAQTVRLHPLRMIARTAAGRTRRAHAINEVSLLRETRQAAKIAIRVDDVARLE
ncbi:MAG: NAD(+)/NADH kinase, partial [Dongiaceae bacterium]